MEGKTVTQYFRILRQFGIFVKNKDIEDISFEEVMEWYDLMEVFEYQNNTFIPISMALKKFFEFHEMKGISIFNIALKNLALLETKR